MLWREGDSIKFRIGGTGAEHDIAYSRYMHICNGIKIAIAAILLVELEMFSSMALQAPSSRHQVLAFRLPHQPGDLFPDGLAHAARCSLDAEKSIPRG